MFIVTVFFLYEEKIFISIFLLFFIFFVSYIINYIHQTLDPFKQHALSKQYEIISSYTKYDIMKSYVSSLDSFEEKRSMISYDDIINGIKFSIFIGFNKHSENTTLVKMFLISKNDLSSKILRNIKYSDLSSPSRGSIYNIHYNKISNDEKLYNFISSSISITHAENYMKIIDYDNNSYETCFHNKRISFEVDKNTMTIKNMKGNIACYDENGYKENAE